MLPENPLRKAREKYLPILPSVLQQIDNVEWVKDKNTSLENEEIRALFPLTFGQPILKLQKNRNNKNRLLRVGVVFSGGQAAGGHNVITGLLDALILLTPESRLFGFLEGPEGIIKGKYKELTKELVQSYRNQGGFDLIGSGRTKIETLEHLAFALHTVEFMELDGLVIVGGDDSNTNAAILSEYFISKNSQTVVIGVPKTIDGDLKNTYVATSFGFDTACKTFSEAIGNITRDCLSAKKYYHFIKLMGRSASHIALECGLSTHPNMVLIAEEIAESKKTLQQITHQIADLVCERAEIGKNFGVILIPEGLIEFIPEIGVLIQELNHLLADFSIDNKEIVGRLTEDSQKSFISLPERIQQQLLLNRDPHGNVQVSFIETEKLLIETVTQELKRRLKDGKYRGAFSALHHFLGYEGRAGFPSNFDCNYCYSLGYAAALLITHNATGYMCCITGLTQNPIDWQVLGIPLTSLMNLEWRKGKKKPVIKKALVDLCSKSFAFYKQHRNAWRLNDHYLYPGPIQFFGEKQLTDTTSYSLSIDV
ncbi:Pyrophosphate--fructose 6-phosphate 1-phosphotransferase [Candidatus Rhabdochlamydia oedothoracis]|uniref:Pyrophosphate--fructose 6-phosphate 1-phosphotransferase n=1 Tax=Candidatus Rhabdochlamydia oedothoracis TaxID=2720720 RepID=A0ABX8V0U0_9BACT|nr:MULTISPECIES: diphosphate--fructose-6-phosphate 1-phosphotransferase [Rhabdochlamydia]KAG6559742.1 Pyrophosphate--fructose 6-phosphate 1-phosphotransferase [Candidatus Rhabdochlamydia sp. W815]QYF48746.1 Pyrophosphate--fructose 6-phosphate 1-phosphotransferase [Candidatus Rhabdochlamydia oedothoracis]